MNNMDIYDEIAEAIRRKLVIIINGECYYSPNPDEIFWIFGEAAYMKDYMQDAYGEIIGIGYDKIAM